MAYVIFILIIVALIGLGVLLLRFMMGRALKQVIRIFREKEALDPESAKTGNELGLKTSSETKLTDGMFKLRDYKPYVFDSLFQLDVIQMTEEGKYFLSEETLQKSKIGNIVQSKSKNN